MLLSAPSLHFKEDYSCHVILTYKSFYTSTVISTSSKSKSNKSFKNVYNLVLKLFLFLSTEANANSKLRKRALKAYKYIYFSV